MNFSKNIDQLNSYLIIALAFFITVSVSGTSLVMILILVFFILEKQYKHRWSLISSNPLVYLIFAYIFMHFFGILWSDDIPFAFETISRVDKLIYIPLLMMYVKKEHIIYYLNGFIFGMFLSEILTYLIWLDILEPFKRATKSIPSPLINYVYYTPFVAMACILLIHFLISNRQVSVLKKTVFLFFTTTMLINLFITGGRGGQVGFFVLLLIYIIFYYRHKLLKGFMFFLVASSTLLFVAYLTIPLFQDRANKAYEEIVNFQSGSQDTSVGIRLALNLNYFEIIRKNPWAGVGTGDYLKEYQKINEKSKYKTIITQPHNMYLLIATQFGIIGLLIFISIFLYQLYYGFKADDEFKPIRIAFPLFFLTIMLVNWYLYSHHTTYLFILFSSIFYATQEKIYIKHP